MKYGVYKLHCIFSSYCHRYFYFEATSFPSSLFLFVWAQENLRTNRQYPDYTNVWMTEAMCDHWPPMYIAYVIASD